MSRPQSIAPIQQSAFTSPINMLVYAYPGEGKTPLWGTGGNSMLIMDSDGGLDSARSLGSTAQSAQVTDYRELDEIYEYVKNEKHEFTWVVWDSLTLFQDRTLIDEIMVDAVADNPNQDVDVPAVRHYLKNMNRIGKYVRAFAALPINFGISCHVMADFDQDGNPVLQPLVQGKGMSSKVSGYMNVIGFLGKAETPEKKQVQRLLTAKVGKYFARDRFNALTPFVDKPTIPKIEGLINAKKEEVAAKASGSPSAATPRRRRRPATASK